MSQSNKIFAFLFAAFVVFITQRGELPTYLGFLLATPKTTPPGPNTISADNAVKAIATIAPLV